MTQTQATLASQALRLTPYALDFNKPGQTDTDLPMKLHMGSKTISQAELPALLAQCYVRREAIEVKVETPAAAERDLEACETLWTTYQNIDATHLTPDGGRSLCVGDIARIQDDAGTRYFQCMNFGWNEITN